MIRKVINSVVCLLLAVLVLASTTSFTVSMHLCRGKVQSMALLQPADNCGMIEEVVNIPVNDVTIHWKACCEDKEIVFQGNEYQYKLTDANAHVLIPVVTSYPSLLSMITPDNTQSCSFYSAYKPPLIHEDVTVMIQTFLI